MVNDRVDLALAVPGVAGVHLGQRSLPADVARDLLGPGRILGLSVHGAREVPEESAEVLDYLIVGTIYSTASHPDRLPGGRHRIREVAGASTLPRIAIGGISPGRIQEVAAAGAQGVAVKSGVWDEPDPGRSVLEYLAELDRWERAK
jgi:thiamine-phosphate pyrophosphorylase